MPGSCCQEAELCVDSDNQTIVTGVWPGDCLELSLIYVREHALTLGIANITVCCFLVRFKL